MKRIASRDHNMKILPIITLSLLVSLAATGPNTNDNVVINAETYFTDGNLIYTAEYDIYNLVVPLNALNFGSITSSGNNSPNLILFFVLADTDDAGKKDYKGLYMLYKGKATKLLDNGRDAAAAVYDPKLVYLAAEDGLYVYNGAKNTTEKYGNQTEKFIGIAKKRSKDALIVINDKFEMFSVTAKGTKMEKIKEVDNAQQLVLDYLNNIYYYGEDKVTYVINGEGRLKISGLPKNPSYIQLLKPPFYENNCVSLILDDKAYIIYSNGTSELTEFVLQDHPTSYAMEVALIQYYAYNKKIFKFYIQKELMKWVLTSIKRILMTRRRSRATQSHNSNTIKIQ